jgi:hypothetical protein
VHTRRLLRRFNRLFGNLLHALLLILVTIHCIIEEDYNSLQKQQQQQQLQQLQQPKHRNNNNDNNDYENNNTDCHRWHF